MTASMIGAVFFLFFFCGRFWSPTPLATAVEKFTITVMEGPVFRVPGDWVAMY